jgi:uncharacterized SAM-binding protein YcdF (DUF218 family)
MEPRRWRRALLRVLLALVSALFLYFGITFVQVLQASEEDGARPAQAIVVLGAAQYDGRPSPVLQERLDHALALYEQDLAPTIVVTGGKQPADQFTEATAGYNYLRDRGVPDEAILKEVSGTNTWESLEAASGFLQARGITDVLLVSDGYHALRLEAIADELGLDADVSPTASARLSRVGKVRALLRETAAVSVGRIIGFRRLVNLKDEVDA